MPAPQAPDPAEDQAILRITTESADLARLYPWLDDAGAAGNVPRAALHCMHIALQEAVMNIAMHAFPPHGRGEILLRLRVLADAAMLVVEDSGPAFDPAAHPPPNQPASLAAAAPGGVGLTLLRHYCGEIHHERIGDGNRLTLRFPLP